MIYKIIKVEKDVALKDKKLKGFKGWRYIIKVNGIKSKLVIESPLGMITIARLTKNVEEAIIKRFIYKLKKEGVKISK